LRVEFAQIPRFLVQNQRAVADAANLLHKMSNFFEHLAQFTIPSFDQNNFVPGIVALAHLANPGRRCPHLP
jgi:hypothetical protein